MNMAAPTLNKPEGVLRERKEENLKFGNSASLASVEKMLYKLSVKCFARVEAMGLGMTFDDVLQEMYVSYVKSKQKWNPQGTALFSTYCTTVCLNNFNHAIKKLEKQRSIGKIEVTEKGVALTADDKGIVRVKYQREFGMISIEEMGQHPDGTGFDPMETMMSAAGPESDSPSYRLESAQALKMKMANLSLTARKMVALLLKSEQDDSMVEPKLRDLAKVVTKGADEMRRLKIEMKNTFGVSWS
jgi:hypothetical protein